jgi:N-acetylglucosamine malate deacetylase 1
MVRLIERTVDRLKPDVLFVPLPSFNQDHKAAWDACEAALRPFRKGYWPHRVLAYEYPGQHWGPPPPATGKVYCPLKLQALAAHQSQFPDKASLDPVMDLLTARGGECGHGFAELFYLLRETL